MSIGPSLDPVNQVHPSTSGPIEAIYLGNMEATRGAARCRLSSLRRRLSGVKEVTSAISHDRFLRRRARHCSSARGGSPSPSDGKRADFCLRCAVYLEGHPDDLAKPYPDRIFAPQMEASRLDRSDIELPAKAEYWLKEMGRMGWTSLEDSVLANTRDLE
ncbi:hypothetical protein MAA_10886 [Metarhizium robertsii ARSEF 23]|nr:uncharacterized protein MAA_10886 [Metarhizium robertsii ARSEF 23]KHO11371.1 hypothetical protein MAA_10886 [Metarhizium robertsii ARSEF 23]